MSKTLLFLLLLWAVSVTANAAIIAEDDFSYDDGELTGNDGGTGWSGAYTDGGNSLTVASTQIDESGGPGLVGHSFRGLSTTLDLTNVPDGEVWMGFDGQLTLEGLYGYGGVSPLQGGSEKGIIGGILGRDMFGISGADTGITGANRIIVMFDLNTDDIFLWTGAAGGPVDVSGAPLQAGSFDINGTDSLRLSLYSTDAGGNIQIDNLVLATTAAEVGARPVATAPDPAIGEIDVEIDLSLRTVPGSLSWDAPDVNDITFDIYFGDTEPNFNNPSPYGLTQIGTDQPVTSAAPTLPLDNETQYWWSVDIREPNTFAPGGYDVLPGPSWTFTTVAAKVPVYFGSTYKDIPGDLNHSFSVDIQDLIIFCEQWLDPFGCHGYGDACADLYGEDGVDGQDFMIIANHWQQTEIPLFINEVLASNLQTEPSNNGEYDDWIEICNASGHAIDLAGMYLTDSEDSPTKWQFPNDRPSETTIDPNGFILIWADGTVTPPATGLHASFKLSRDGDDVRLYDTDGQTLIDVLEFGEQTTDVAFGREPDASDDLKTLSPTPNASNNNAFLGLVADTKFNYNRGFYDASFNLAITCETPGTDIYYTLDGSEPDLTAFLYSSPFTISQTTCVRAIAVKPGYKSSNIDTHTYIFIDDVLTQSPQGQPPGADWPTSDDTVASVPHDDKQLVDYGMDPDIVNDGVYGPLVDDALLVIPSLSIVTDMDNLFDYDTGIYFNAFGYGPDWERPASLELINPDGSRGFQVDMGLRIRGGYSRFGSCPKHAFRCFFGLKYGDSKLKYNWFDNEEDAGEFDKMDLRTAQNYSWSYYGDASNNFMRDVFSRDLQGAMGQPYTRSRFYHLYINGQYWGLYQTQERSESSYAASYFGGNRDDYDVVKADGGPYRTWEVEVTDGYRTSHDAFWTLGVQLSNASNAVQKNAFYNQMRGLNPDGSSNPNYPVYLDPDNLIDVMLNVYYVAEQDSPISAFYHNNELNNWFGIFNRNNPDGFKYFRHDAEHSMGKYYQGNTSLDDRTGPLTVLNEKTSPNWFNPQTLHQWLVGSPDYLIRFADRTYKHMFNDGVMTEAAVKAQYDSRAAEIEMAIIAESARWGDAKTHPPRTKAHWVNAVADTRNFLNNRVTTVIGYLRNKDWYPSIDPPKFFVNGTLRYGGDAELNDVLTLTNPNSSGEIYYTTDGSDPRLSGGAVNPASQLYVPGPTSNSGLISTGAVWKYLYDGSDQGTAWQALGFDDSAWNDGPGELGFGDGGENTDIGPKVNGRRSAYFRHVFNVADTSNITDLSVNLLYDDGAVVYLNEQEIGRVNMPDGTVSFDTLALIGVGDNPVTTITGIDSSFLVNGSNILAVEIHQYSNNSSDLSFDLSLDTTITASSSDPNIILDKSVPVKARVLDNDEWSALADATFNVGPVAESLRITELMYHPADPNTEYIELQNIGSEAINLNLVEFTKGVNFVFGDTVLTPGQYVLVVENIPAFEAIYGNLNVAGQYTGALDNDGDRIKFKNAVGTEIQDFNYEDNWYGLTDGLGFSLTLINVESTDPNDWDRKSGWRSSLTSGGTPAASAQSALAANSIVINELLAHSHNDYDWIELHNTTNDLDIDISGWFLSDDDSDPNMIRKYEIPNNTVINAGSFMVIYENTSFGSLSQPVEKRFALSEDGETAYLYSGNNGEITGYYQTQQKFGASERDISFGRYEKTELSGGYDFTRMKTKSPGSADVDGPLISDVVITEIHYNPVNGIDYEYVELYNRSNSAVTLMTEVTTETTPGSFITENVPWRLEGTGFEFPTNTTIPANTYILVAKNPAMYSSAPVAVYGPYDGKLDNDGEQIEIQIPGDWEYGELSRYWIPIEKIDYDDSSPWPITPDGGGDSLHRINPATYGRDYSNWQAAEPM